MRRSLLFGLVASLALAFVMDTEAQSRDERDRGGDRDRGRGDDRGGDRDRGRGDDRGEELKVRILKINARRGEIEVDVAGRRREFEVEDRTMLRRFEEGDLAIISVRRRGPGRALIVDMRSASVRGRVVDVNDRRGEVVVSVDGRDRRFFVDRRGLLRGVRRGDRIRFEFEDRPGGRKVITAVF